MNMDRRNEAFFALIHLLQSGEHARSRHHAAAAGIVDHEILPIIQTAFETYPEKDTDEVLSLCKPALIDVIVQILKR